MISLLIYPAFMMFVLFIVAYINLGLTRARLVKSKRVPLGYFKGYVPKDNYPVELYTSARLISNLFETPLLYFVVVGIAMSVNYNNLYYLVLSWIYVIVRYAHAYSFIRLSDIKFRFYSFLVSLIFLILMWIDVLRWALFS